MYWAIQRGKSKVIPCHVTEVLWLMTPLYDVPAMQCLPTLVTYEASNELS